MTQTTNSQSTYLAARKHVKNLLGGKVLIHSCYCPNDDGPGGRVCHERIEGDTWVWSELVRAVDARWRLKPADIMAMKTIDDLTKALARTFSDGEWACGPSKVETLEQFEARRRDEIRQELEREASDIARRHNCSISSMEWSSSRPARPNLSGSGITATG
jgi:hypothetical protein